MRKRCTGPCNEEKDVKDFPFKDKKRGYRRSRCWVCQRAILRKHYEKNKPYYKAKAKIRNTGTRNLNYAKLYQYLAKHPCVDCGEADIRVLEFDHIDRENKIMEVTMLVRGAYSWEAIEKEIKKCKVRCCNCHRRRTAKQFNWRKCVPL
jgi:hypothetical protein